MAEPPSVYEDVVSLIFCCCSRAARLGEVVVFAQVRPEFDDRFGRTQADRARHVCLLQVIERIDGFQGQHREHVGSAAERLGPDLSQPPLEVRVLEPAMRRAPGNAGLGRRVLQGGTAGISGQKGIVRMSLAPASFSFADGVVSRSL